MATLVATGAGMGYAPIAPGTVGSAATVVVLWLLPISVVGRLVFLVYEIVTRKRVNQRVENIVHLAGFVALAGLLIAVTLFGDLARIFRR